MLPPDPDARRLIAAERAELLRAGLAEARVAAGPRRRLGEMLISAGVRLAPDAAPRMVREGTTARVR